MTTRNWLESWMVWWKKGMGKVAEWNCRARGIFAVMLMLSQFDAQVHMVCVLLHVLGLLWDTCRVREIKSNEINVDFIHPIFVYGQGLARPGFYSGFHLPPVSNSQHPWAVRKSNSPWHRPPGSYGTSPSWWRIKITVLCRDFSKIPQITNWAGWYIQHPTFIPYSTAQVKQSEAKHFPALPSARSQLNWL